MLSAADNELLTRTGADTPMGALFRRYWLPVALTRELPQNDGPPKRVRLLGENLLLFRDSAGKVGLVEPRCPHRGADLYWGRNEQGGLRCVFHGWKYDLTGRCVDMPSVPAESGFRDKIRIRAYPTREAGGAVWAYLGPAERMPAFPMLEFTEVAASHSYSSKKLQECNWAQVADGALDTAHFSFLHMVVTEEEEEVARIMARAEAGVQSVRNDRIRWLREDPMPKFTVAEHDAGLTVGAARRAGPGELYWRISQYLMPNHAYAPSTFPGENFHCQTIVPITDEQCWVYCFTWNPGRALTDEERTRFAGGHTIHAAVDADWVPIRKRANEYLIDRDQQKHRTYTGITGVSEQDACIQDSQGAIADRTRENLGPTDLGIVRFRRLMLETAKALAQGSEPRSAAHPDAYRVRAGGWVAGESKRLAEVMKERFDDEYGRVR
ncbi:MAG: ring-hydroxylating oxygenase subunit alpha [Betaproteobacteria bacterium]|nr:ring-hydroxylating oxygenase subunit alpha [Betaproteobacteria bacterium]